MANNTNNKWTLDTLEIYFNEKITNLERMLHEQDKHNIERCGHNKAIIEAASLAAAKAIEKAEVASEARFASVNEFRAVLSDQASLLLPRAEFVAEHKSLIAQFDRVRDNVIELTNTTIKRNESESIHKYIQDQITVNTGRLTTIETALATRKEGLGMTGGLILGGFAVMSAIVSAITLLVHIYK